MGRSRESAAVGSPSYSQAFSGKTWVSPRKRRGCIGHPRELTTLQLCQVHGNTPSPYLRQLPKGRRVIDDPGWVSETQVQGLALGETEHLEGKGVTARPALGFRVLLGQVLAAPAAPSSPPYS